MGPEPGRPHRHGGPGPSLLRRRRRVPLATRRARRPVGHRHDLADAHGQRRGASTGPARDGARAPVEGLIAG